MHNGHCPQCNSSDVFKKKRGVFFGNGVFSVNTGGLVLLGTDFESFVCANCGYFENYIVDNAKLQEIREKWTRVE